ncbi:MAG: alpha/beta hydrolase [Psychroserpens sp.]|uniref:alpha/beta hydrolase family protein n=1 Tax=Psychroserpens sp. TaxID=2020870 RepID=UPI003C73F0E7
MDNPIDFPDLNAFAQNNYTQELNDLDAILNHIASEHFEFKDNIDITNISLIGHSRGGGISILKTSEDSRIKKLITWASVSNFHKRMGTPSEIEQWRKDGVKYVLNGRTKQKMPHHFQFYEDFKANEDRLHIELAVKRISIPTLIVHAEGDPSVDISEAKALHSWNPNSVLLTITDSNHVFGAHHPYHGDQLPKALKLVVDETVAFIENPNI